MISFKSLYLHLIYYSKGSPFITPINTDILNYR